MKSKKEISDPLQLLSLFQSGIMTIGVNGFPVLKVDGKERTLDLEAQGLKKCGVKLSKLASHES